MKGYGASSVSVIFQILFIYPLGNSGGLHPLRNRKYAPIHPLPPPLPPLIPIQAPEGEIPLHIRVLPRCAGPPKDAPGLTCGVQIQARWKVMSRDRRFPGCVGVPGPWAANIAEKSMNPRRLIPRTARAIPE